MKPWERFQKSEGEPSGGKPWERFKVNGSITSETPQDGQGGSAGIETHVDPVMADFTAKALSRDPAKLREVDATNEWNALPAWKKPLVAADDIVRLTADGLTFGYGDTLAGKVSEAIGIGPTTEERRENTEKARARAGGAGLVAEIAGSAKTLGLSPARLARNKGLAARLITGAAEGMGIAALNEHGHGREVGKGDLALGAIAGAGGEAASTALSKLGQAIGQGVKKLTGKAPKVPSTDELERVAKEIYRSSDDAGVMLSRNGLEDLRNKVVQELTEFGFHPGNHKSAQIALAELNRLAKGHATLKGFDQARKVAKRGFKPGPEYREANKALSIVMRNIDEHIAKLKDTPGYVIMGNGKQGAEALEQARKLWAQKAKSEAVEYAINKANRSAATAASGGNTENRTRQEIAKLLEKRSAGWTAEEKALAEEVARGTPLNNTLRLLGRLSPQGNGVGLMYGLGAGAYALEGGDVMPLAGTVIGALAKPASKAMTNRKAQTLAAMMRAGGSKAALYGPDNALQRLSKDKRDILARLLLSGALVPAQQAIND